MIQLEIIYRDDVLIAINKPYGYFVHKSSLDATSSKILMKILRKQIGEKVYPIHRLDRKTTGVLLFALNEEVLIEMNRIFENRETSKRYIAICRGFMKDEDVIDYPLYNDVLKREQEAITRYRCLQKSEIDIPLGRFQTSRYSLTEFIPETGRMHQIRRHAAHIFHPIIADRPHGCNKQNKLFLEKFNLKQMLLHAVSLELMHPINNEILKLKADFSEEFKRIADILSFDLSDGVI